MACLPLGLTTLHCGLSGLLSIKAAASLPVLDIEALTDQFKKIKTANFKNCQKEVLPLFERYLGSGQSLDEFQETVRRLKTDSQFIQVFLNKEIADNLMDLEKNLSGFIQNETQVLQEQLGKIAAADVTVMTERLDGLKDAAWCLKKEIGQNIEKISGLTRGRPVLQSAEIGVYKKINSVLNSIDRLEVRGRDSAGISLLFTLKKEEYDAFSSSLQAGQLADELNIRVNPAILLNRSIHMNQSQVDGQGLISLSLVYKIAAEIGSLGDNIAFLRKHISEDMILPKLTQVSISNYSISAHTRWASVGAITEPNCHPVDSYVMAGTDSSANIIHVCLNGDIDNYLQLKEAYENQHEIIPFEITTDTKIIPLQIEHFLKQGLKIEEAFRQTVNQFEGSHAISMHTSLAPGKLFLAQKGSGQTIFIGLGEDSYMPTSEVYGFVEETSNFLKMDGEQVVEGSAGPTQGQLFVCDQDSSGGLAGISARYYDGTPLKLDDSHVKNTEITSRDIDRQNYPHYFLKEISESPLSVELTLQNRWKVSPDDANQYHIAFDENAFPQALKEALENNQIRRVYFVGQGTAGVAALACSDILNYYLSDPSIHIGALKASELSGFKLYGDDGSTAMSDTLVVAISQSGTTTDTNRTVDMVKDRGAYTLAIVNRRDSDITFKVDGVIYTSSGRDIEMSVASTKAFYSQIVAGALIGLNIADVAKRRTADFISSEIQELRMLPNHMRQVLEMKDAIQQSARRLAASKSYWAVVGSGPNKASADEIRIKLSELCYKTISSDFVEDKKHIDLSAEPLIIVCAAGTRNTVVGDIIKDTAIFQAHKAAPVIITDEGEDRFTPYAKDVFQVPKISEHLSPILNTLVGHIWGYYAALAINEGSRFLHDFREDLHHTLDDYAEQGLDVFEAVLEKSLREKIATFYRDFRAKRNQQEFPTAIAHASDLTLLLKYMAGKLPVSDFELDFGVKGTAKNMLNKLFEFISQSINFMSRPVDAIKHQAKTVTVGTSRISEKIEGLFFDSLAEHDLKVSQLLNRNVLVLRHLQGVIDEIKGAILYRVGGLNLLGEPTDDTTIEIVKKSGVLAQIPSRVEKENALKGTKKIIVRHGNVYIGKGRKDDRSIVVIPLISTSKDAPNIIEYILLLNIEFKSEIPLPAKIKALGGKYEHIRNIVQENSIKWQEDYIELVETKKLFGISAEKIGEYIVSRM